MHVYIHEGFVCVLTKDELYPLPEHSGPWSCRRGRFWTKGSAQLLHLLRSFSPAPFSYGAVSSPLTGAPCLMQSSHRRIPCLQIPSVQVDHFQNVTDGVSHMEHLLLRVFNWFSAPHIAHGLRLSSGPGFFASPILQCFLAKQCLRRVPPCTSAWRFSSQSCFSLINQEQIFRLMTQYECGSVSCARAVLSGQMACGSWSVAVHISKHQITLKITHA